MKELIGLCIDGLNTDGEHHKQWYLEKILERAIEISINDTEKGIAP